MGTVEATVIDALIARFLASKDPGRAWVRAGVLRHHFLPVYLGWVEVLGVRPDGSIVRWMHEDDPERVAPCGSSWERRFAGYQAASQYPELAALMPERPEDAVVCGRCDGSGIVRTPSTELVCGCGGVGWVIPGEYPPGWQACDAPG